MNRDEVRQLNEWVSRESHTMASEMSCTRAQPTLSPSGTPDFRYVRLRTLGRRNDGDASDKQAFATEVVTGLYTASVPFSLAYVSDGTELFVYLGAQNDRWISSLLRMYRGTYPTLLFDGPRQFEASVYDYQAVCRRSRAVLDHKGFIKGNPYKGEQGAVACEKPIDTVIRCMAGRPWSLQLFATPENIDNTLARQKLWLERATRVSAAVDVSFVDTDNQETTSYHQHYVESEEYGEKVSAFCELSRDSVSAGEWCVAINYAAASPEDADLLSGLVAAVFHGDGSEPEPLHAIERVDVGQTPLVNGWEYRHASYLGDDTLFPRYATLLSSGELSIFASLPAADVPGLSVRDEVVFDVDREQSGDLELGEILNVGRPTGTAYRFSSNQLNRHALVVGLTGSGKTNTLMYTLYGISRSRRLPFMVIEPAKREYWKLAKLGLDKLQIYSVGSGEPGAHRLCINPFERASVAVPDGSTQSVSIQTHIDLVFAAFKASFIMYTPMPYVLERAIYEIYEDFGWDILTNRNIRGKEVYPTIEDLYFKIPSVVESMGYDQRMRNDLIGSLQARINSLRIGSKGATLNVERSFPFEALLDGWVVIELDDIGDDDVKAFIISLLLVNLSEVRRQQEDCQQELRHVTLIEEAHRLLRNIRGGTGEDADPRGAAVEFFCNQLAELRSKGEGFIVADQIPSKLAPDIVKNTNLKITHRLVDAEERCLMGGSMHMTERQSDELSSLRQGVAAVYSEGDYRPKLVMPPRVEDCYAQGLSGVGRIRVLEASTSHCVRTEGEVLYRVLTKERTEVCRRCAANCHRQPRKALARIADEHSIDRLAMDVDPRRLKPCTPRIIERRIREMLDEQLPGWHSAGRCAIYCVLGLLLNRWHLPERTEQRIINGCFRLEA